MDTSGAELPALAIVARCSRTGQIGIGLTSASLCSGARLDGAIHPNAGAVLIQGAASLRLNQLGTRLLAQGHDAVHTLLELKEGDPEGAFRQIVVIDRDSNVAVHSGTTMTGWSGVREGSGCAAACLGVDGSQSAEALLQSYESAPDCELDERLLRALESGADAETRSGRRSLRSSALVVWDRRDYSETDLRVDWDADPVAELRRIYHDFKPTAAYYEARARNPREAISVRNFEVVLKRQRAQDT